MDCGHAVCCLHMGESSRGCLQEMLIDKLVEGASDKTLQADRNLLSYVDVGAFPHLLALLQQRVYGLICWSRKSAGQAAGFSDWRCAAVNAADTVHESPQYSFLKGERALFAGVQKCVSLTVFTA